MNAPLPSPFHVRWMIRRDMPEVLAAAAASPYPWPEDWFLRHLRERNTIGLVAELGGRVVGQVVYSLHARRIVLHALAVAPDVRRRGAGRALVEKLRGKLGPVRVQLVARVRETDLDAQLFWRAVGLNATRVDRAWYPDTGEDAYRFQLLAPVVAPAPSCRCDVDCFGDGCEGWEVAP